MPPGPLWGAFPPSFPRPFSYFPSSHINKQTRARRGGSAGPAPQKQATKRPGAAPHLLFFCTFATRPCIVSPWTILGHDGEHGPPSKQPRVEYQRVLGQRGVSDCPPANLRSGTTQKATSPQNPPESPATSAHAVAMATDFFHLEADRPGPVWIFCGKLHENQANLGARPGRNTACVSMSWRRRGPGIAC